MHHAMETNEAPLLETKPKFATASPRATKDKDKVVPRGIPHKETAILEGTATIEGQVRPTMIRAVVRADSKIQQRKTVRPRRVERKESLKGWDRSFRDARMVITMVVMVMVMEVQLVAVPWHKDLERLAETIEQS